MVKCKYRLRVHHSISGGVGVGVGVGEWVGGAWCDLKLRNRIASEWFKKKLPEWQSFNDLNLRPLCFNEILILQHLSIDKISQSKTHILIPHNWYVPYRNTTTTEMEGSTPSYTCFFKLVLHGEGNESKCPQPFSLKRLKLLQLNLVQ